MPPVAPTFGYPAIGARYLGHVAPDMTVTGGLGLGDTSLSHTLQLRGVSRNVVENEIIGRLTCA